MKSPLVERESEMNQSDLQDSLKRLKQKRYTHGHSRGTVVALETDGVNDEDAGRVKTEN